MIRRPIGSRSIFEIAALRALAAAVLGAATSVTFADTAQVGEVSLLIGEARVVRDGARAEALRSGAAIRVGDRIETSGSGHVFVRFVDHGAVSLRPGSVLEVQAYRYDPTGTQANEVRLRVEQGTSRSISGAATHSDKSRFRLNTPIAAIGVRGTDFVVQTDARITRATVAEGSIVVGALGERCPAQALGPCQHADVTELSADMGRLLLEMRAGEQTVRVRPVAAERESRATSTAGSSSASSSVVASAAEAAALQAGLLAAEPDALQRRRGDAEAAQSLEGVQVGLPGAGPPSAPDAPAPGPSMPPPVTPHLPGLPEVTLPTLPDRLPPSPPDLNRPSSLTGQLAWGRWTFAAPANDEVSRPFAVASIGRHITVGDERVGLFRADDPSNPDRLLPATLDERVAFSLSRGHAAFESAAGVEAASIDGGSLVLDFGRRTFATALGLSSPNGGAAELRAAGDVRSDGTFAVRGADHHVAGAVSLDGREAGYLFERSVTGGMFRGTTLWGR